MSGLGSYEETKTVPRGATSGQAAASARRPGHNRSGPVRSACAATRSRSSERGAEPCPPLGPEETVDLGAGTAHVVFALCPRYLFKHGSPHLLAVAFNNGCVDMTSSLMRRLVGKPLEE